MKTKATGFEPERLTQQEYVTAQAPVRILRGVHRHVPLHWHEFYELSLILSGHGNHRVNGAVLTIEPNTIFLLTPADFHELEPDPGESFEILNVIFTEGHLSADVNLLVLSASLPQQFRLTGDIQTRIRDQMERLFEEQSGTPWGQTALMGHLVMCLVIDVLRAAEASSPAAANRPQHLISRCQETIGHDSKVASIAAALAYVNHHFRESLRLDDVARHVGLSRPYLSDTFHAVVGHTFQDYLQGRRVDFAARLLLASDMSVTEVCFASGFNTLSHFTRVFKQRTGTTPLPYRNRQRPPVKITEERRPS